MTDWKEALAPSPECIEIARLGEELTAAGRVHLDTCARCQAELAMFREIAREETSAGEAREVEWIASELRRRNIVAFRPKTWRVLYAAAAVFMMVVGISYWMQMREPSIDTTFDPAAVYRTARVDVVAPKTGDLAQPPNELRWTAVPDASRYAVQILEVDMTPVWGASTTETHVTLPPDVIAQFAPGKLLLWDVAAFRGKEMIATSDTQNIRVSVAPPRKDQ